MALSGLVACGSGSKPEGKAVAESTPEAKAGSTSKSTPESKSKSTSKSKSKSTSTSETEAKTETEPEIDDASASARPVTPGDAAIILDGKGLARLTKDGKTEVVVAAKYEECDVDDVFRVVWLASETELAVYDQVEQRLTKVATSVAVPEDLGHHSWRVQLRDDDGRIRPLAGTANGRDDCVALVLELGSKIEIGSGTVSEGDRDWYCFDEDTLASDHPVLVDEAKALAAHYDRAKLVNAEVLAALDKRRKSKGSKPFERPPPPPPPVVKVDDSECKADPEDCGTLQYAGGGRLWWVTTENDSGDFYYETKQLYDATTKRWWVPEEDRRTTEIPRGESDGSLLDPSPDGTWGLFGDKIVTLTEPAVTGKYVGTFCGWG